MKRKEGDPVQMKIFYPTREFSRTISRAEKDVVREIAHGHSHKEIANKLFRSPNTVRTHVHNVLEKTHCKNNVELTLWWYCIKD